MKISFVIPCYNSELTIRDVVDEIKRTAKDADIEIVLVNDNSRDGTWKVLKELGEEDSRIKCVSFARNFGQHSALLAGYSFADGDVVVSLDDDGQTPADEFWKLVNRLGDDCDVCYAAYKHKQHNAFRNMGTKANSLMAEWLINKPHDMQITSYFAMKKFVKNDVLKYRNAYPYVPGLVLRATANLASVEVNHRARSVGKSGYSFSKLVSLWMNGFTAFSVKPLRLATFLGGFVAFAGAVAAVVTIIRKLLNPDMAAGWASTFSAILLIGGLILAVLGMIGEYIGRIYISINSAPQYVIKERINTGDK